ncbi:MAG: epsH [Sphingomonas bacterium]|nr:epsH [Sphingomonas bacterium]MDB5716641.1 epsH [Sphingomonas bacterium]
MSPLPAASAGSPDISFLVASYNAAAFLEQAVRSALAQRGVRVEVLIVDDGSTDESRRIAQDLAAEDPRVRCLRTPVNLGPAGARNIAVDAARGTWLAVLDSDDRIDPYRSCRLIEAAEQAKADMIADDLLVFDGSAGEAARRFLDPARAAAPGWIGLERYFAETRMFGRTPDLGFLKPMIRADFLRAHGIRYDESLRIAEDDALIVRLLLAGARYWLLPEPLYHYRKHASSISHRLSVDHVDRMMAAGERLKEVVRASGRGAAALAPRHRALRRAWAFTHLVEHLKHRRLGSAMRLALRHPTMLPLLRMPIAGALRKLRG